MTDLDSVEQRLPAPPNLDFPNLPIFTGPATPCRFEAEVYSCLTRGVIPAAVNGTYYRTMPDHEWAPNFEGDIYLNGDGVVNAFKFKDGTVDYKHKFVRTRRFLMERAARKSLWGRFYNKWTVDPRVNDEVRGTANTHIVYYNDTLLALSENLLPFTMNPETLETYGAYDFQGQFKPEAFTAHPKIDPATGEMMSISYEPEGPPNNDMMYYMFDQNGRKLEEFKLEAPYFGMTHDIAFTEKWVIAVVTPNLISDEEKLKRGHQFYEWNDDAPLAFGLIPRRNPTPDKVKWYLYKNAYGIHTGNAFDADDGSVILDIPVADSNRMYYFNAPEKQQLKSVRASSYYRFRFYPNSADNKFTDEVLFAVNGEMPIVDGRYLGKPYSKAFLSVASTIGKGSYSTVNDRLTICDIDGKVTRSWYAGPSCAVGEMAFCPRSETAPEGDGYVIAVVDRHGKASTSMVILDTATLENGPIGIVNLPFRLRLGAHGSWVPEKKLPEKHGGLCDMTGVSHELLRTFNREENLYGFQKAASLSNGHAVKANGAH